MSISPLRNLLSAFNTLFSAFIFLYKSKATFLVILPMNVLSTAGLFGGIEFHVLRYVSLKHSSASSLFPNIFIAIVLQYLPYFSDVALIAFSSLSKYS